MKFLSLLTTFKRNWVAGRISEIPTLIYIKCCWSKLNECLSTARMTLSGRMWRIARTNIIRESFSGWHLSSIVSRVEFRFGLDYLSWPDEPHSIVPMTQRAPNQMLSTLKTILFCLINKNLPFCLTFFIFHSQLCLNHALCGKKSKRSFQTEEKKKKKQTRKKNNV